MNGEFLFWLVVSVLFLIGEIGSPGLFLFLSFFIGALITAVCTFFIANHMTQLLIFLGSTVGAFFLLQIWIRSRGSRLSKKQETNIYALKGKRATVVQEIIPNKPGYISLYGVLWLARSTDNKPIAQGVWVEILDMQGAHLLVKEIEKDKQ